MDTESDPFDFVKPGFFVRAIGKVGLINAGCGLEKAPSRMNAQRPAWGGVPFVTEAKTIAIALSMMVKTGEISA